MKRNALLGNLILTTALASPAFADNAKNPAGPWYLSDQEPGWHIDAYIGGEYEPTYAGSDRSEFEPDANLRVFYRDSRNQRYFASLGEIGGLFEINPDLMFTAVLEYEEGRDAEEDDTLKGLEEIDDTVEGQFSLSYRFLPSTFVSAVFQPDLLGKGKGLVYFLALGNDRMLLDDKLRLSSTVDISFANREYMETEFGVTASESEASGLSAFDIGGGLKSFTVGLSAEYYFGEHWSFLLDSEFETYLGDTVDSPLIKDEGSEFTSELSAGIRYRF